MLSQNYNMFPISPQHFRATLICKIKTETHNSLSRKIADTFLLTALYKQMRSTIIHRNKRFAVVLFLVHMLYILLNSLV